MKFLAKATILAIGLALCFAVVVFAVVPNENDLVKTANLDTVYYYSIFGQRHVFPNYNIFYSWFNDFSNIITVDDLSGYELGENVMVRGGTFLVTIQSTNKIYGIEPGGILRWYEDEDILKKLYGNNYQSNLIDIPSSFFFSYTEGQPITDLEFPRGTVVRNSVSQKLYLIGENNLLREITGDAFEENGFLNRFIQVLPVDYPFAYGNPLDSRESIYADIILSDEDKALLTDGITDSTDTDTDVSGELLKFKISTSDGTVSQPIEVDANSSSYQTLLNLDLTNYSDHQVTITSLVLHEVGANNAYNIESPVFADIYEGTINPIDDTIVFDLSDDPLAIPYKQTKYYAVKGLLIRDGKFVQLELQQSGVSFEENVELQGSFPVTGNEYFVLPGENPKPSFENMSSQLTLTPSSYVGKIVFSDCNTSDVEYVTIKITLLEYDMINSAYRLRLGETFGRLSDNLFTFTNFTSSFCEVPIYIYLSTYTQKTGITPQIALRIEDVAALDVDSRLTINYDDVPLTSVYIPVTIP